jgi:ribosomal protein S18 acetylase RimI-like enzyme
VNQTSDETLRPFDLHRDLDGMTDLIDAAFAGELQNWGGDFREQIRMAKQTVPMLTVLSRLSANFQHVFDGFVCETQGKIVSMVNVQKTGFDIKRWMIGNVATHPNCQRRGLARKLVSRAIEHARTNGAEVVMLDVRTTAQPAYNLYRSLGFVHYDSTTSLKLETLPQISPLSIPDYNLRALKLGEWQARYQLAVRETPQAVQDFLPVSETDFRVLPIEHATGFLAQKLQGMKIQRWAVERNGQVVAVMTLAARSNPKIHHELSLRIHPDHRTALAEPLLTLALAALQAYPRNILRIETRTSYTDLLAVFKKHGFIEIETNHRLGLKFN